MLDALARKQGFKDAAEMHQMVASVDLTHQDTRRAFMAWKEIDGSRAGLETVLKIKEGANGTPAHAQLIPGYFQK